MTSFTKIRNAWDRSWKYYEESKLLKIAVNVALLTLWPQYNPTAHYEPPGPNQGSNGVIITSRGEVLCQDLIDMSNLCVNSDSEVHWRYTRVARTIELVRGEASVTVHKGKRPFNLLARRLFIHDIATSFNVRIQPDAVLVTVTEGRIRVVAPVDSDTKMRLQHGEVSDAWKSVPDVQKFQRMEFNEQLGKLMPLPDASEQNLRQLAAWKEGRILLNGRTVDSAIQELRRYADFPDIKYPPWIGKKYLQGEIPFNDWKLFLDNLSNFLQIPVVQVGTGPNAVIYLSSPPP